jgi:5-methylcytosine-specific restriction endonuclease McrA
MSKYSEGSLATAIINLIRQKRMKEYEKDELEVYYEMLNEKVNYKEYIKSPEWKETSRKAKERVDYHCQLCNKEGNDTTLNTHHNNYERLGLELDSDLIVLCKKCHAKFHDVEIQEDNNVRFGKNTF